MSDFFKFASENARREFPSSSREDLPNEADVSPVFCERCKKFHRPFRKEDHDRVISESAKKLAEVIDKQAAEKVYREYLTSELDPRD